MVVIKGLDGDHLSKLLTPFIDRVTCLECCKLYVAPETAKCGHTYCHTCWKRRRTCQACASPLDRGTLKLNKQIQCYTDHAQALNETFEKIFKFKLDEFDVDYLLGDVVPPENECIKNVKEWLASSQNQFSPQLNISEPTTQDSTIALEGKESSKAQIHSNIKKVILPQKVIHKHNPQDDWEKIELMPETEKSNARSFISNANPVELEISSTINKEYTMDYPRRSSRNRDSKSSPKAQKTPIDQHSSKTSSTEVEKQSMKNKKKWGNVKRMKQEFSKLNKKNRSKLNISIEMCKKAQGTSRGKNKFDSFTTDKLSDQLGYVIEDNTPGQSVENEIKTNINKDQVIVQPVTETDVLLSRNNNGHKSSENSKIICPTDSVPDEKAKNDKNKVQINNNLHNNTCDVQFDSCNNNLIRPPTKMPFIKKSALYTEPRETSDFQTFNYNIDCSENSKSDDIEVTIKVGNTITNIVIRKNHNDVQPSNNVDQEVQTSLGPHILVPKNKVICSNQDTVHIEMNVEKLQEQKGTMPTPSKKNTASAETVTANFEITESVEKELSNVMECGEPVICDIQKLNNSNDVENTIPKDDEMHVQQNKLNIVTSDQENREDNDHLHDLDIFEGDSVKEAGIQLLKDIKNTASEILAPTAKSNKIQTQKNSEKRKREECEDIGLPLKKQKVIQNVLGNDRSLQKVTQRDECNINDKSSKITIENDSENINYDTIMGHVFASIDADIHLSQKSKLGHSSQNIMKKPLHLKKKTQVSILSEDAQEQLIDNTQNEKEILHQRCSENVFTLMEKENESNNLISKADKNLITTQQKVDYLLTPGMFQDLTVPGVCEIQGVEGRVNQVCTPLQEHDDDDKSIVEETPQKNASSIKSRNKPEQKSDTGKQFNFNDPQNGKGHLDLSETPDSKNKETTNIDTIARKWTETPLTINKFTDHIKHKSTPVSRKSLNFDKGVIELDDPDPEQTLCPTSESAAKTTQEKIFMTKAFEKTPISRGVLGEKVIKTNGRNFCVAGSCLSSMEIAKLKTLCRQQNWKYTDTFKKELTHLVVGVDDENKSQRSVKYMCALAASKWIVSFKWVEVCLKTKEAFNEEYFEVLDGCGEPGPKRSRIAKRKLFEGISFYCMPPFSVLDIETLKTMIEAAGGQVVNEIRAVCVTDRNPSLLLAEPENTQENKFIYLAMELKVVPVNYEWVLNCLGNYTLASIFEPLLCPMTLLPSETACWPSELISQDYDEQVI